MWFTIQPEEFNGYVGERAILSCEAIGLPGKKIKYLWFKSSTRGGPLTPLDCTKNVLVIESLKDSDLGYYTCQASDQDNTVIKSEPVCVNAMIRDGKEGQCLQLPVV